MNLPFICVSPTLYFCFAKIVPMIIGEYEQRALYKHYDVVGNGPDSVLLTFGAIYYLN